MDAIKELNRVMSRHDIELDDEASLELLARLRASGVLDDRAWEQVLAQLDELLVRMADEASRAVVSGDRRVGTDADPVDADWLRVRGARRASGYRLASTAALWLWWLAHSRDDEVFWPAVGRVAADMGFERLKRS